MRKSKLRRSNGHFGNLSDEMAIVPPAAKKIDHALRPENDPILREVLTPEELQEISRVRSIYSERDSRRYSREEHVRREEKRQKMIEHSQKASKEIAHGRRKSKRIYHDLEQDADQPIEREPTEVTFSGSRAGEGSFVTEKYNEPSKPE